MLFVLPAFALFLVFRFGPAAVGILLSLFRFGVEGSFSWAGSENFARLIAGPGAVRETLNEETDQK